MKLFSSEVVHNYGTYTFAYAQYALREKGDSLAEIYAGGYLPYSGSPQVHDTLYMARSARVPLQSLRITSENRRIAKRFDERFSKTHIPLNKFDANEDFYTFCLTYFAKRHGEKAMPRERLLSILHSGFISHIVAYKDASIPVAYVFEMRDAETGHYWFSFYDLSLTQQSLGLWLMLDCVRDAKEAGLNYYYLGTVYGEKALYKTNFEPLQWWDGQAWNADVKLLRERGRSAATRAIAPMDTWKENRSFFSASN